MSGADTYSLLDGARAGDGRARGELFDSLRARLVLWCASRMSAELRAKVEPEDLAQEILLVVCRDLGDYAGNDRRSFYAWIFRIAENRIRDAADHWGAQKRRPVELPPSWQTTPGTAAARNEAVSRLTAAVGRLPEDQRRVVQLRRIEEREFDEIAREMGRSVNAIRIVYCRALKALRSELGDTD